MNAFLALSEERRGALYAAAGDELGMTPEAIEKDFWVCLILRELFLLDEGHCLTFKGGTSLSKGWGLIERLSEDIDVVIDRELLGFGGQQGPEAAPSRKKREARVEAVVLRCRKHIEESLAPRLKTRLHERFPMDRAWKLTHDPDDEDRQTLLFEYPSLYGFGTDFGFRFGGAYLRPIVKIELGARSDTEPSETPMVSPYVMRVSSSLEGCPFPVRTVAPERTFWEKAMLLHEESFREGGPRARLSRHYYDLWCLWRRGVGGRAMANVDLFDLVAQHRATFFPKSKPVHDSMRPGSLKLVPYGARRDEWKRDYEPMREAMIFGETPTFDEIIAIAQEIESQINQSHDSLH